MRRTLVVAAAVALIGAACSSGDGGATPASAPVTIPLTTVPSATTGSSSAATTEVVTTTTVVDVPTYPLTGLPVADELAAARPALVVKIDNHPEARPQTGLGVADIVFEENVEGITRFASVFQSQGSDPVGPIRSGRTQDVALLGSLSRPLFAWSGGNSSVTRAIDGSDFVNLSAQILRVYQGGGFFRSDRPGPHDLYAQTTMLWSLAPPDAEPPPPQFSYRADGEMPAGDPSAGVRLEMDGVHVDWTYDAATSAYLREQNGRAHTDAATGPIAAANVVALIVRYAPSPADARSPEAQTIGSGEALVFTGGNLVRGTWERSDRLQPFTLRDADGTVIELTPGSTWVELAREGAVAPY